MNEYKKMLERFEQICQNAKKELSGKKEKEQEKNFIEKIDEGLTISEYDEIEYWLANVEVLDNTDYILNNRKAKILVRYLKAKDKEIDRLNNIINGMETFFKYAYDNEVKPLNDRKISVWTICLDKLKELKEE